MKNEDENRIQRPVSCWILKALEGSRLSLRSCGANTVWWRKTKRKKRRNCLYIKEERWQLFGVLSFQGHQGVKAVLLLMRFRYGQVGRNESISVTKEVKHLMVQWKIKETLRYPYGRNCCKNKAEEKIPEPSDF